MEGKGKEGYGEITCKRNGKGREENKGMADKGKTVRGKGRSRRE